MDTGTVILGIFVGWFIGGPLALLGWAWIRHLLLPIWPWPDPGVLDYSSFPIECHPRYNAKLGKLVD